jgi:integrase
LRAVEADLVETVVAAFVERHIRRTNRSRTAKDYERLLEKEIVAHWRGQRLSAITRQDINRRLDEIADRGAPVTANRTLSIFRKLCRWAVSRDIIQHSPCDGVAAPAFETPRDRVLDDRELASIWRAADTLGWPFTPIVRLLMLTGQRRGEVASMAWAELDLAAMTWTLPAPRTKNKRPHTVPLAPQVIEILAGLPHIAGTDLLFAPGSVSRSKRRLDAAITAEAGPIPPWTLHDLRRSAASGMARLGVDLHVIERCLNHVSGSFGGIVGVYQKHRYETQMRQALETWAAHIESVVIGKTGAANVVSLRIKG